MLSPKGFKVRTANNKKFLLYEINGELYFNDEGTQTNLADFIIGSTKEISGNPINASNPYDKAILDSLNESVETTYQMSYMI